MLEFEKFLVARGVPFALTGAVVSVYVQFICAVLILIGFFTRLAAILLILNFAAALWIAHLADTFVDMFQALTMLVAGSIFFSKAQGAFPLTFCGENRVTHDFLDSCITGVWKSMKAGY